MNPQPPSDRSKESRGRDPEASRPSPAGTFGSSARYKLILHRSPDKDLMFIVRTVMELTRYCKAEATHRMWEAYHSGTSQILVTHFERAELYLEQFSDRGLQVSLEPMAV